MRYRTPLKTLAAPLISLLLTTNIAHAEDVVLRYSQWVPSSHWSQGEGLHPWFEKIAEVTEGRVTVEASKRPMVPVPQNYQALTDGRIDLAYGPHGYTPGRFPLTELVEQPFITHHAGHSSAAYWRMWEQFFEPTGMHNEVVTLAMTVTAGGNLHMRDELVKSLDDLRDKHMRVPTRVVGRALDRNGGDSVIGQLRAVSQLLSTGKVDGTALIDGVALAFGISRAVKAVTQIPGGLYASSMFVAMSKEKWDMISPKDQAAIREISGYSLSRKMGQLSYEADNSARETLKQNLGENYYTATPEFVEELKTLFLSEQENWISAAADIGVDGQEAIALFQSLVDEESDKP